MALTSQQLHGAQNFEMPPEFFKNLKIPNIHGITFQRNAITISSTVRPSNIASHHLLFPLTYFLATLKVCLKYVRSYSTFPCNSTILSILKTFSN
jgi:hypothetical protein